MANPPTAVRRCRTRRAPLPGAQGLHDESALQKLAVQLGAVFQSEACGHHLAGTYGVRGRQIADLARADPALQRPMVHGLPFVWAEMAFVADHEMVITLHDAMVRRTDLFYRASDQAVGIAARAAAMLGARLGWDADEQARQVDAYFAHVRDGKRWTLVG
jgi:glycerol-3-phosphate dehydrogenase